MQLWKGTIIERHMNLDADTQLSLFRKPLNAFTNLTQQLLLLLHVCTMYTMDESSGVL